MGEGLPDGRGVSDERSARVSVRYRSQCGHCRSAAQCRFWARLDPTTYQTALDVARAEREAATAEYERVRQLWEKSQAVARAEVERKRTAMDAAGSRFAAAQKDLADTRLTAPFAGIVARRLADNFQNVQAKEPVVSLQNPDALEIVIHVPERVVRGEPRRAAGFAVFSDLPERRFPVTLKSFATEADPQTQTYEVVLGLTPPPDLRVLPGMAVEVLPQTAASRVGAAEAGTAEGEATVLIPIAAVVAAADGTPTVWVVDPESGRVGRRTIETGALQGADLAVLNGLAPGEQIVTAGVHSLREGMRVHALDSESESSQCPGRHESRRRDARQAHHRLARLSAPVDRGLDQLPAARPFRGP